MKAGHLLQGAVLAGTLALYGCSGSYPELDFNGYIGEEHVYFESRFPRVNRLVVKKPDGSVMTFTDSKRNDLKVDRMKVRDSSGNSQRYDRFFGIGKQELEEGQKAFDSYIERIKEAKLGQGLKR